MYRRLKELVYPTHKECIMKRTMLTVALTGLAALVFVGESSAQYSNGMGSWFPGRRIIQGARFGGSVGSQVGADALNVAGQAQAAVNPANVANGAVQGNATVPGTGSANPNATVPGTGKSTV